MVEVDCRNAGQEGDLVEDIQIAWEGMGCSNRQNVA